MNLNRDISNTAFKPIKVMDIELSRPCMDINVPDAYEFIHVLARLHGAPIGYVKMPLLNGHCTASDIRKIILKKHRRAIIRHLLYDGLMSPSQPGSLHISHLLNMPHPAYNGRLPLVTVAVCTRNRTDDLARCLESLCHLDYPLLDILVIDNAPNNDSTEYLVRTAYQSFRYIREPRPGLNWARNRAIIEARGEIIAYTDDDVVVDSGWVRAFAEVFAENEEVMAITGLVAPYELETDAQILFEEYKSFGRGFERKWYQVSRTGKRKVADIHGGTGKFGTGANMAYRLRLFDKIGYFDPALDVGTVTNGGGDLEMFFRVVKEGYALVYEPRAIVRHCHRRSHEQLKAQMATWHTGFQAYLVRTALAYPDELFAFIRLWIKRIYQKYTRQLAFSLIQQMFFTHDIVLTKLRDIEFKKHLTHLFCYYKARRIAATIAQTFGTHAQTGSRASAPPGAIFNKPNAIAVRTIDISKPMHSLMDILEYAQVRIFVNWGGNHLGSIDIANHYQPIGIARLRDSIIDAFTPKLLEPDYHTQRDSIETLITSALTRHYSPAKEQSADTCSTLPDNVSVSIVVKAHDRPDNLRACLQCLVSQESSRHIEIIVINTNPPSHEIASIVAEFPGVVLINEPRTGQAYAYNRGFIASKGDIVTTTNDNVTMPANWLEKLIAPFVRSNVMVVTGNVLPQELENSTQVLLEKYFSLGHGHIPLEADKDWFKSFEHNAVPVWNLGSIVNAAFRSSLFRHPEIGLINEEISAGIPDHCRGDIYLFYKALKAGYTLIYEPSAFVWYTHHRTMRNLYQQLYYSSKGIVVYHLTTIIRDHDLRALSHLIIKMPKMHLSRIIQRLYGKSSYPLSFLFIEAIGNFMGFFTLVKSIKYIKRKGHSNISAPITGHSSTMPDLPFAKAHNRSETTIFK